MQPVSLFETKANKHISPHHPYIRYSGRVDKSKKESVSFDWPGVASGVILPVQVWVSK
jgi:hypothetical protein